MQVRDDVKRTPTTLTPLDLFLDAITGASLFSNYYADYLRSASEHSLGEGFALNVIKSKSNKGEHNGLSLKIVSQRNEKRVA